MDYSIGNLLALAVALASLAFWAWLLFVRKGDVVPHPESERTDAAPAPAPSPPTAPALCRAFTAAHDALAGAGFEVVTSGCEEGPALPSGQRPLTLAFTVRAGPGDAAEPEGARDAPPPRRRVELGPVGSEAGGSPCLRLDLPDGSSRWLRVGREAAGAAGRWLAQASQAGWRLTVAQVRESGGVWTLLLDDGHTALGTLVVPEEAGRAAREMLGG